jgi:hypothetical protein
MNKNNSAKSSDLMMLLVCKMALKVQVQGEAFLYFVFSPQLEI